jgi:hypothetical protein
MEKQVFYGNSEKFGSEDVERLMKQMDAEDLGSKKIPYDDSGFCRRGQAQSSQFYYSGKENVVLEHRWVSDTYWDSEIILKGTTQNIKKIKKKVLEAIASIKFDPEGFRKD